MKLVNRAPVVAMHVEAEAISPRKNAPLTEVADAAIVSGSRLNSFAK
jgi:hypothetical protein